MNNRSNKQTETIKKKRRTKGQNADGQMSKATRSEKQDEQMTTQNTRRDKTKHERRGEGRRVDDGAKKKGITGGKRKHARRGRAGQEVRDETE